MYNLSQSVVVSTPSSSILTAVVRGLGTFIISVRLTGVLGAVLLWYRCKTEAQSEKGDSLRVSWHQGHSCVRQMHPSICTRQLLSNQTKPRWHTFLSKDLGMRKTSFTANCVLNSERNKIFFFLKKLQNHLLIAFLHYLSKSHFTSGLIFSSWTLLGFLVCFMLNISSIVDMLVKVLLAFVVEIEVILMPI